MTSRENGFLQAERMKRKESVLQLIRKVILIVSERVECPLT